MQVLAEHGLENAAQVQRWPQIAPSSSAERDRPGQSVITRPPRTAPPARKAQPPVP